MEFGKKFTHKNLNKNDDIWDINLFYNLESDLIKEELSKKAREFNPPSIDNLLKDINDKYANLEQENPSDKTINRAKNQEYKKLAPQKSAIFGWIVVFWLAVLAETTILILQQIFSLDFNPFIIILAIILAIGGYFQGKGLGAFFYNSWEKSLDEPGTDIKKHHEWILIGIGSALILLVSIVRAFGSSELSQFLMTFLITFLFGEAVSISEALHFSYNEKREFCLNRQEYIQRYIATLKHNKELENYKEYYKNKLQAKTDDILT